MANVTLSKERWYVTADRTRAVKGDNPEAAYLLVGKGGAIAPEVAAHYGIETYSGEAIDRVSEHPVDERNRMVTPGTGNTAERYEKMAIERDVRDAVTASLTTEGNRSATRQGEMMAQSIIAQKQADGTLVPEPETGNEPEPETTSRTKEIPAPGSGEPEPPNEPDAGANTATGQAGEHTLEGLQELEDAKEKTL